MTAVFHEEWFGEASQAALVDLYERVKDLDGDIVEVGCWEGRSTCALANATFPQVVRAVDTWEGSPGEISEILAADQNRDVYATFLANVQALTKGNVSAYRVGWRDYFGRFDRPLKFVHIDATHTYEEVRDNLDAVLPLMVEGGIVCGDDVHHPPIQQAVIEKFPQAQVVATLWFAQV